MLSRDKKKALQVERELMILYRRVFGTPEGKQVYFDLLNRNYFLQKLDGNGVKEGRREAVLDIIKFCNFSIQEIDQMLLGEERSHGIG